MLGRGSPEERRTPGVRGWSATIYKVKGEFGKKSGWSPNVADVDAKTPSGTGMPEGVSFLSTP
jgi:hypothetical protein